MDKTGIIWTEKTWNPVTGCKKVDTGCKFCYAETIANKFGGNAFPNNFNLTLRPQALAMPLKWKEPTLVFVNSMSDLFWDEIPKDYLHKIIDVIEITPQHQYQILTKRPEAMLQFSKERKLPSNFWAGVTVAVKNNLNRIEILKQIEAEIRFISFEPLLEDLGFDYSLDGIHWAITGGESGNHLWKEKWQEKRGLVYYSTWQKAFVPKPETIVWIKNILKKCRESDTKFFHKQWGGHHPEAAGRILNGRTYNEIPKLPGRKRKINNEYLKKLEKQIKKRQHNNKAIQQ